MEDINKGEDNNDAARQEFNDPDTIPLCFLSSTSGFQNIVVNVMKLLLDIMNMFVHRTHFHFRFDVHLVVQVRLDAVFGSLPVLADQDKNGEKDSLK